MDTWKRKVAVIFLTEIFMFFFCFVLFVGCFTWGWGKGRDGWMVMVNGQKGGKERRV